MYEQSCRVVVVGGGNPMRFGGASCCRRRSVTCHIHCSAGVSQVCCVHLGKAIHRLAKALVAAADGEQRVQRPALPRTRELGVLKLVLSGLNCRGPGCAGGGVVVGGKEGVDAVYHPGAGCRVVGGCGEGVVYVVHEGHVRGGGWLLVVGVGTSPGMWSLRLLQEAIRSTHIYLSHALVSAGVTLGGGRAMLGSL